jgi:hypothetical protein
MYGERRYVNAGGMISHALSSNEWPCGRERTPHWGRCSAGSAIRLRQSVNRVGTFMKNGSRWRALFCALLTSWSSLSFGQVPPESPIHMAVNGVFYLCPTLIRQAGAAPSNLASLGFEPDGERQPDEPRFRATGRTDRGLLFVSYQPARNRCILDYSGAGYVHIAGAVRDTIIQNGYVRIAGEDNGRQKADVFEGRVPGSDKTGRIIIVENYAEPSASISYSER